MRKKTLQNFVKQFLKIGLPGLLLAGCQLIQKPAPTPKLPPANGIEFFVNCELPKGALSVTGKAEDSIYAFKLEDGDRGYCEGDYLAAQYLPYRERAELSQLGHLDLAEPQILKFEARFMEGFMGRQESFLQIQNVSKACKKPPSLIMKWHKGQFEMSLLQDSGMLKPKRFPDRLVKDYHSWSQWKVLIARISKTSLALDITVNGENIGRGHVAYTADCAKPWIKFGIFRPGNGGADNKTSAAEFRKFSVKPLNPKPPKPKPELVEVPDVKVVPEVVAVSGANIKKTGAQFVKENDKTEPASAAEILMPPMKIKPDVKAKPMGPVRSIEQTGPRISRRHSTLLESLDPDVIWIQRKATTILRLKDKPKALLGPRA